MQLGKRATLLFFVAVLFARALLTLSALESSYSDDEQELSETEALGTSASPRASRLRVTAENNNGDGLEQGFTQSSNNVSSEVDDANALSDRSSRPHSWGRFVQHISGRARPFRLRRLSRLARNALLFVKSFTVVIYTLVNLSGVREHRTLMLRMRENANYAARCSNLIGGAANISSDVWNSCASLDAEVARITSVAERGALVTSVIAGVWVSIFGESSGIAFSTVLLLTGWILFAYNFLAEGSICIALGAPFGQMSILSCLFPLERNCRSRLIGIFYAILAAGALPTHLLLKASSYGISFLVPLMTFSCIIFTGCRWIPEVLYKLFGNIYMTDSVSDLDPENLSSSLLDILPSTEQESREVATVQGRRQLCVRLQRFVHRLLLGLPVHLSLRHLVNDNGINSVSELLLSVPFFMVLPNVYAIVSDNLSESRTMDDYIFWVISDVLIQVVLSVAAGFSLAKVHYKFILLLFSMLYTCSLAWQGSVSPYFTYILHKAVPVLASTVCTVFLAGLANNRVSFNLLNGFFLGLSQQTMVRSRNRDVRVPHSSRYDNLLSALYGLLLAISSLLTCSYVNIQNFQRDQEEDAVSAGPPSSNISIESLGPPPPYTDRFSRDWHLLIPPSYSTAMRSQSRDLQTSVSYAQPPRTRQEAELPNLRMGGTIGENDGHDGANEEETFF